MPGNSQLTPAELRLLDEDSGYGQSYRLKLEGKEITQAVSVSNSDDNVMVYDAGSATLIDGLEAPAILP